MALMIQEIGSFYVGGEKVRLEGLPSYDAVFAVGGPPREVNPNGDFWVGQMYVQYVCLANRKSQYPLLLWHGGGFTGSIWEHTPDGRPGWQSFFLHEGHDVYVSDAVERGRASWARYPEIYTSEPVFRNAQHAWESFRIGPSYHSGTDCVAYEDTRFPVQAFDSLMMQSVPRWNTNGDLIQAAYDAYVRRVGKSVIVAHSQGGAFAIQAAINSPQNVAALVLVEPSGAPAVSADELRAIQHIPHFIIWGDYVGQDASWQQYYATVSRYRLLAEQANIPLTWLELPQMNITGNSHLLYADSNSDEIAAIVQDWIRWIGLM